MCPRWSVELPRTEGCWNGTKITLSYQYASTFYFANWKSLRNLKSGKNIIGYDSTEEFWNGKKIKFSCGYVYYHVDMYFANWKS